MDQIRKMFRDGTLLMLALLRPAAKSVRENMGLAALSVVLAFVLWIFVTDTEGGTTRSGTLPDVQLVVEPVNVPRGLTVAGEIPTVRVRVEVDEKVWSDLRSDDFQATVDLADLSEGRRAVPVKVEARTGRGRLEVLGAVDPSVNVTLVPLFTKSVPVEVQVQGTLPVGLESGDPVADPGSVTVSGTEELVGLVGKAVAVVDVNDASSDIDRSFPLEARDDRGLLVKGPALDPAKVSVTLSIQRKVLTRILTVSPSVKGTPAQGYNVTGVSVNPPVVAVSGASDLLNSLSVIRTDDVEIDGASGNVSRKVQLAVPAGASVAGSVDVAVIVTLEVTSGQATFGVTPHVVGLAAGLRLAGALPSVEVTLTGPLPVLNGLISQDLDVRVDLSGLSDGAHTVDVKVEPPAKTVLASVTPAEIQVSLQAGP